jgi:neutral ceramidase
VPAEFTSAAGRRLRESLRTAFVGVLSDLAVSNYTNAYSGYVTTPEEYAAQHYEGASTLYGPHTLAAYVQTFQTLAAALVAGTSIDPGSPAVVTAVYRKRP